MVYIRLPSRSEALKTEKTRERQQERETGASCVQCHPVRLERVLVLAPVSIVTFPDGSPPHLGRREAPPNDAIQK